MSYPYINYIESTVSNLPTKSKYELKKKLNRQFPTPLLSQNIYPNTVKKYANH